MRVLCFLFFVFPKYGDFAADVVVIYLNFDNFFFVSFVLLLVISGIVCFFAFFTVFGDNGYGLLEYLKILMDFGGESQ